MRKTKEFEPMKAASELPRLDTITFPKIALLKYDGFRCAIHEGRTCTRNKKEIANRYVREYLEQAGLTGLDGELLLNDTTDFSAVQSAFTTHALEPNFKFVVFDSFLFPNEPFSERLEGAALSVGVANMTHSRIELAEHRIVYSIDDVQEYYNDAIARGYEGLILRDPTAPYKYGRSTLKQQWMLKLKPLNDMEVRIIDFEELEHNLDTSTRHKDNMVGGDTLGAFICDFDTPEGKATVKVGTGKGLTAAKRKEIWESRSEWIGKTITIAYQELSEYGIPRFPRLKGVRYD